MPLSFCYPKLLLFFLLRLLLADIFPIFIFNLRHGNGSTLLRKFRDRVQGIPGSGTSRRRSSFEKSSQVRGEICTPEFLFPMRADRHLAGHAQDRRRVDVGGEQPKVVSGPRVRWQIFNSLFSFK